MSFIDKREKDLDVIEQHVSIFDFEVWTEF